MYRRTSLGAFLLAMFILGFYLFAHWQMMAEAKKLAELLTLQEKIIEGIDAPPKQPDGHFWGDLRQAGIVGDEDAAILKKHGYEYVPLGPDSPPDAVLFRQTRKDGYEKHVYANGRTGYEHRWTSPDGRLVLCDKRSAADGKHRFAQFLEQPQGREIGLFSIDGYERAVLWNATGELVAMNASLAERDDPFTLWHVAGQQVKPIPLPAELDLESLLAREAQFTGVRFGMHHIEAKRWQSARELFVFAQGAGTFDRPDKTKMGFNFIYYLVLDVQGGQCRLKSAQKQHFAASPCTSCR